MSGEYSYIDIACDDLTAAKEMMKAKLYNHAARLCQQYVEKVLKECVHKYGNHETDLLLLHTHRLYKLAARCGELKHIIFDKLETTFMRELTDYYFDTNYPGENYIKVTEQEAVRIYDETVIFKDTYEKILCA
jgi:HEPN domain-containing protein